MCIEYDHFKEPYNVYNIYTIASSQENENVIFDFICVRECKCVVCVLCVMHHLQAKNVFFNWNEMKFFPICLFDCTDCFTFEHLMPTWFSCLNASSSFYLFCLNLFFDCLYVLFIYQQNVWIRIERVRARARASVCACECTTSNGTHNTQWAAFSPSRLWATAHYW